MIKYFTKRILLVVPTLIAIIGINFLIVQLAPGGPIETVAAQMRLAQTATHQFAGTGFYRGDEDLDPAMLQKLNNQFGFDKPPLTRFLTMLKGYLTFSLGDSFFQAAPVSTLILQRLPVSVSLGLWSTLLVYLISIPLGIHKAVHQNSAFDKTTTALIVAAYAVPGFLLGVCLIILFGAGGWVALFPLRGLASPGAAPRARFIEQRLAEAGFITRMVPDTRVPPPRAAAVVYFHREDEVIAQRAERTALLLATRPVFARAASQRRPVRGTIEFMLP